MKMPSEIAEKLKFHRILLLVKL